MPANPLALLLRLGLDRSIRRRAVPLLFLARTRQEPARAHRQSVEITQVLPAVEARLVNETAGAGEAVQQCRDRELEARQELRGRVRWPRGRDGMYGRWLPSVKLPTLLLLLTRLSCVGKVRTLKHSTSLASLSPSSVRRSAQQNPRPWRWTSMLERPKCSEAGMLGAVSLCSLIASSRLMALESG